MIFLKVNARKPESEIIQKAARVIKSGGLVAFPTETVYGLGANTFDRAAVKKIFKAKGRPLDNPLIVHIAESGDLERIAKIEQEQELIIKKIVRHFWPGPLTLVLKRKSIIPSEVSAGLDTVAVRMPSHPVALALIRAARAPIAAPSANLAGRPSPTQASHVVHDLGDRVDLILDAGSTEIGLESTVLDLTVKPPTILRRGGVTAENLRKVLGKIRLISGKEIGKMSVKSPGMKYRHYAPKARVILINIINAINRKTGLEINRIQRLISEYQEKDLKVGILTAKENQNFYSGADKILVLGSKKNLKACAKNLFSMLRKFDAFGIDVILAETFPDKGIGAAIMERLRRAAGGN